VSRLSNLRRAPILCYVTDRHILSGADPADSRETLLHKIEAAAGAGVDWIQIREKDLSGKDSSVLTREALRRAARGSANDARPARIIVNDRLDVALSEHAGGVHLGEKSLPIQAVKRLVDTRGQGEDFLIGASCHSLETVRAAAKDDVDYLFFGPVFATPSKAAFGAPQGLERLAEVCRTVSIPVLAIGGITLENAESCLSAGAAGIAAIRLFQDAYEITSLVRALRPIAT
jgi:thiamine-phosphate pyrophosphorylase